ncbi:hypothetical protein [Sphingomonas japonica]
MLAGLIFATEEADDKPGALAATLPFGGMTLIEYQARLLIACGAGHLMIAVARVTPALLGAVNRIAKRGVAIDIVRSAEEASAKAHPLAAVIVLADGLVTTEAAVRLAAGSAPDTLIVSEDAGSQIAVERVDAGHVWAGIAAIAAQRLADTAALPREYDFQSTLLRVAVQAGAHQVQLPTSARRAGHGVERNSSTLASRSNAVLAALATRRTSWADRFVFTPITRLALPLLVSRGIPPWSVVATGGVVAVGAVAMILLDWTIAGVVGAVAAVATLSTGSLLGWLRGDDRLARRQEAAIAIVSALAAIALGAMTARAEMTLTALVLAIALVVTGAIGERARARPAFWWGSPAGYLLLLAVATIAGYPAIGLAIVASYAAATLAAAVEALREKA